VDREIAVDCIRSHKPGEGRVHTTACTSTTARLRGTGLFDVTSVGLENMLKRSQTNERDPYACFNVVRSMTGPSPSFSSERKPKSRAV
jgi:hypothetical protein